LFVLGLAAEPALIEAQMRESAKQEPQAWAKVNSLAYGTEGSPPMPAGAASVRGSYCSLVPASYRRFPAAAASGVPGRPLKAWEASRSLAEAPGPERPSERWAASRLLLEPKPKACAPPSIPARSTGRT